MYDIQGKTEYEANAFAAQLLISDEEVLNILQEGYTVSALAGILGYEEALVLIKLNEMRKLGQNLPGLEIPPGNFLRNIRRPGTV